MITIENDWGERTKTILPDNIAKDMVYDAAGRGNDTILNSGKKQQTIYEFSGVVDKIEYRNAAGTLTGTDDFTYNDLLRRTAATSRYGINNGWTYDDQGRMLTESTTYSGQTYNVGYRYDSRGRLDEITYPSGRKAAYTFDERSSIDLIQWDGSTIEDRGYDDLARLNATTRTGSAVDETRSYDNAGRLTGITNTNVGDASYTYDANHNKLSESWTGAMAAWNFVTTNGGANQQGYDAEDRFVHFAQAAQSKTVNFTRSDIGNINNINLNGTGTARGFNNIHALTSIGSASQTFDTDGNLTTSQFGHTNTWDEAGFMKQSVVQTGSAAGVAGTNEYGYDATQRRIFKKITRNSSVAEHTVSIHAGPNLIAEYPAGTAAATPSNEFVYAQEIDSLVLLAHNNNASRFTITRNQQWSVTALSDASSGTVVERYTYDHFGKRTILEPNGTTVRATSSYAMPFGYTSRQHDAETGLMYFRARYFDPSTAEFISPDPLEYVDGMSLFRGYYMSGDVDPNGTNRAAPPLCNCMRLPIKYTMVVPLRLTPIGGFCRYTRFWYTTYHCSPACFRECGGSGWNGTSTIPCHMQAQEILDIKVPPRQKRCNIFLPRWPRARPGGQGDVQTVYIPDALTGPIEIPTPPAIWVNPNTLWPPTYVPPPTINIPVPIGSRPKIGGWFLPCVEIGLH